MDSNIKVGVRIRPFNRTEVEACNGSSLSAVSAMSGKHVVSRSKKHRFEYDWAFDEQTSTRTVYELSCRPLIENIFEGFNATFFACKLSVLLYFVRNPFLFDLSLSSYVLRWTN